MRIQHAFFLLILLLGAGPAAAADNGLGGVIVADPPAVDPLAPTPPTAASDPSKPAPPSVSAEPSEKSTDFFSRLRGEEDAPYSIVSVSKGLSTHKPMYILPLTYSPDYPRKQTEFLFSISAKVKLFGTPLFFGYSQRSFWQLYDGSRSRPFRETDYNPELFYRWIPDPKQWHYWGADFGMEHESNGQEVPQSRSWNRLYVAPFRARGRTLIYLKAWYRLPEDAKKNPEDAKGDDNPDIEDHYGYGELHLQRQIGKRQVITSMFRLNPETGRGALNLNYTIPSADGSVFYQLYLWHGYGESLLDYNDSVTRVGLGVAFSR